MPITFHANDLDSLDVQYLVELHYAQLRAISPPDACHVLPAVGLRDAAVTVWSAREEGQLVGVAALKELAPDHGEVKSMRTVPEARGRGVGRCMLRHMVAKAQVRGYKRLSLETGIPSRSRPRCTSTRARASSLGGRSPTITIRRSAAF